jgi:hypothetical protein
MATREVVSCDVCKRDIDNERHHIKINMPVFEPHKTADAREVRVTYDICQECAQVLTIKVGV